MIGLVASSAGAFVALPSTAMPEPAETGAEIEATEVIAEPSAAEALPTPEAEALETDVEPVEADLVEEPTLVEEEVAEEEVEATEEVAAEEITEEEPVAEEVEAPTEPVAEEGMEATEEPVAEDAEAMEEPVAGEEVMEEEPVTEDAEAMEEPVADEEVMEEEPVAGEEVEEPVAGEELNTADFTIAELTDNSDSFEILAAALAAADLTEILGSDGPFTVFAPTDDAFAALPEGSVDQLLLPENKDVLVQVLTYHVVPGAILSTDLEDGSVATVEGSEVEIAITDTVTVNNANVVATDIEASNGIIHVIDRVIIPPSPEADAEVEAEETAAVAE
ncbi:MAG: fasciclin domain-containing protein [Cyanobacteria bacterium P01_D01_bin.36]